MEYHSGGSLPLLGRPRYCPGANANGGYLCETGHCCGESGCCTYYYELWWFWLLWTLLILFSCCCAYRHRRAKLRVQQQQRQREISLLAYHGANSYPSSMLDLSFLASLKLPSYEEVAAQPSTPPPPYSSVFTAPRYPQPPRTVDPHLLTQHGPLLHHPFSDGPSSLSSDNSSSCSCDSCCPSSPCSSSLSAPITYETDTSHASTPSEAAPLNLDLTLERITTVASCLEVNGNQSASERTADSVAVDIGEADAAGAQEPVASDASVPAQTVTVAVVTRGASPQPSPSEGSEGDLPLGATSPAKQQLDTKPCTPIASTCSSSMPSPNVHDAPLPCNQRVEGEPGGHEITSSPQTSSTGSVPSPTESTGDGPGVNLTPETPRSTRTFCTASLPSSPTLAAPADVERTLALITDSPGPPLLDPSPSLVPIPAASNPLKAPVIVPSKHVVSPVPVPTNQAGDSVPVNLNQNSELIPSNVIPLPDPHSAFSPILAPVPSCVGLPADSAAMSPTFAPLRSQELSPESVVTQGSLGSVSDAGVSAAITSGQDPDTLPGDPAPRSILAHFSKSDIIGPSQSKGQGGFNSGSDEGSGSGSPSAPAPLIAFPSSASSSTCPAITVDSESVFTPVQSPTSALSSPSSLPSPPFPAFPSAVPATSIAPGFLLDPINARHQSEKGGSSSGHASSLSPSPRTTQSPPKQTLFSPCVDVFEPGPPNWEEEEEEEQEEDNEEDEDDDIGADESQYRHRRLTGDSGIEVCRCRVEKEDDDDEEEEEQKVKDKAGRGEGGAGERNKKENGGADLHDSIDCPARGHMTAVDDLTRCNPSSTTASSDDCGEVVIVMERV